MTEVTKVQMSTFGPALSEIVQGYWRLAEWDMTPQQRLTFLKQHLELGISTVDHAHVYGSPPCEELFGEALKLAPGLRDKIEVISKCGIQPVSPEDYNAGRVAHYCSSRANIIASVEMSLTRLNVEHLDVLLIHRPDLLMDADEVADAFAILKQSGKVDHFGVSNFSPSQFALLQSRLEIPLVTNQVEINPLNFKVTEDGTLDQLQQLRIRPMAWSCMAGGRVFDEHSEQTIRLQKVLTELKEELNVDSIDQVILAWIQSLPSGPVPMLGTGKIDRVLSAVKSLQVKMNYEQWYRVWVASKGYDVP